MTWSAGVHVNFFLFFKHISDASFLGSFSWKASIYAILDLPSGIGRCQRDIKTQCYIPHSLILLESRTAAKATGAVSLANVFSAVSRPKLECLLLASWSTGWYRKPISPKASKSVVRCKSVTLVTRLTESESYLFASERLMNHEGGDREKHILSNYKLKCSSFDIIRHVTLCWKETEKTKIEWPEKAKTR